MQKYIDAAGVRGAAGTLPTSCSSRPREQAHTMTRDTRGDTWNQEAANETTADIQSTAACTAAPLLFTFLGFALSF